MKHRPEAQNLRLKASRRELAGKLKKHVVRREVKKSMRGGKEGGAQDAKRVADKVAHMLFQATRLDMPNCAFSGSLCLVRITSVIKNTIRDGGSTAL